MTTATVTTGQKIPTISQFNPKTIYRFCPTRNLHQKWPSGIFNRSWFDFYENIGADLFLAPVKSRAILGSVLDIVISLWKTRLWTGRWLVDFSNPFPGRREWFIATEHNIHTWVYIKAIDYFTRSRIETSLRNKSTPCNTGYILTVKVVVTEWCYLLLSFTKSPWYCLLFIYCIWSHCLSMCTF